MEHLTIAVKYQVAMAVHRIVIGQEKLVYVIVADRPLRYRLGRSPIAYIGETKTGAHRVASSLANKANSVLASQWGVRHLGVLLVTCRPLQRVKTGKKLETALLLCFRERYGEWPKENKQGKKAATDEFSYFRKVRVMNILKELEDFTKAA